VVTRYGNETITGVLTVQGNSAGTTPTGAAVLINNVGVNSKGLALVAAVNQGADMLSLMDNGGNTLLRLGAGGALQNYGAYAWIGALLMSTPTIATVGTAGSTTYGYRIAAVTSAGSNTLPSSTVSIATGNATLDTTNYVTLTWNPVIGAATYRVYGRTAGSELLMATVTGDGRTSSYSWNDQGTITPAGALPLTPAGSTTLTVQGWNSQTPNLANFLDGANNQVASITSGGVLQAWVGSIGAAGAKLGSTVANAPVLDINGWGNATSGAGSLVRIKNNNITGAPVQVALAGGYGVFATPQTITNAAAVFQGISGQTGALTLWRDPTGAQNLLSVDVNGGLATRTDQTVLAPVIAWGGRSRPARQDHFLPLSDRG
jgi:hypothetical protein